jgi:hypothetical protein
VSNRITQLCWSIALLPLLVHGAEPANQAPDRWQTIPLVRNEFLSARLQILRVASAADEDWIILEMENLTGKPLSIDQTTLLLEAEFRDLRTDKPFATGGLNPPTVFRGVINSDVVRVSSKIWPAVSCNLGLLLKPEIKVIVTGRLHVMMDKGHFISPPSVFAFNWIYPDAAGIAAMKGRLKQLLQNPQYNGAHSSQLCALFRIPEAAEDLTVDELLTALKSRQNSVDGRDWIVGYVGQRFATDPNVIAFASEQIRRGKLDDVKNQALGVGIWNPVFVPLLVDNFETSGDYATLALVLEPHHADWGSNTQVVSRLSAALLKHRPLLTNNLSEVAPTDLFAWVSAAHEAAIIGDKGLLKILAPALDDQRMAIHPQENDLAAMPVRLRVCDHAIHAIAKILGVSMKRYPLKMGRTGLEPQAECDRTIADLKKRIAELDSQPVGK